jgi:hypothetical protein
MKFGDFRWFRSRMRETAVRKRGIEMCLRERNHRPKGMLCTVLLKLASLIRNLFVNLIVARQNEM